MNTTFSRFRLRSVAAVVAGALAATAAWAVEPFTVRDIRVEGLQRVEPGTIFASLPLRVGDTYNDERGSAAIRALFDLGLFKDVRIDVNGNVLVIIVEERPTIAEVDFVGTKEFDKAALQKALREVGLADARPYDKALADRAEQELKRQYVSRSLYNAQVVTTVTPIERNRVNLTFTVTEGEPARIREVHIVGNKAFSEGTLLSLFDQDAGGWLSWYTKSNQYSRAKLNADLETLRSYYLTRGYMEFRIDSTQVAISPDREDLSVTVNISEGEKFVVSGVKLTGNYLGRDDEFKSLVTIQPGEPYNGDAGRRDHQGVQRLLRQLRLRLRPRDGRARDRPRQQPRGADAQVRRGTARLRAPRRRGRQQPHPRRSDPARVPSVRGLLVRRRQDQAVARPGRPSGLLHRSQCRYARGAGFARPGRPGDQRRREAHRCAAAGRRVLEFREGRVHLRYLPRRTCSVPATTWACRSTPASTTGRSPLTTTDPYFTKDGISRTFALYHTTSRPYYSVDGDYKLVNEGGNIRFGVPFSEVDTIFFGAGLERYKFDPGVNPTPTDTARLPALLRVYPGRQRDRVLCRRHRLGRPPHGGLGP